MGFDVSYGGAFIAGLLSFLSPCVLPLVPPYLCFLAGVSFEEYASEQDTVARSVFLTAVAFVLGFTTVFVLLGATAGVVGQVLTRYLDILSIVAGAVILLVGLHFLGVLRLTWLYASKTVDVQRKPPGMIGGYVVGLAFCVWLDTMCRAGACGDPVSGRQQRIRLAGRVAAIRLFARNRTAVSGCGTILHDRSST